MKPLVLIVEDDAALSRLLAWNLEAAGFEVATAFDGEEALARLLERRPDIVLLDWMLPGLSGLELCRRIRRDPEFADLPVVMLTARGAEPDRVRGFDQGADDYVTKPFSMAELIRRLQAVLRRARPGLLAGELRVGDVVVDLERRRAFRGGRELRLAPTEFRLLRFFAENPGRVFSRLQLIDRVWGGDADIDPRAVDAAVRRLRRELNAAGEPDPIRTVRAEGYAFEPETARSGDLAGR